MSTRIQGGRSHPEHMLLLDPFDEKFRYLVMILSHEFDV